jgi:hypothetical protein
VSNIIVTGRPSLARKAAALSTISQRWSKGYAIERTLVLIFRLQ